MKPEKRESTSGALTILLYSTLGWAAAALLGTSGMLLLQIPGFSHLAAAQITAGIIGLGGGFSYGSAIRAAGGKIEGKNAVFIAVVWTLSCIAGITPLFFTLGTPVKMMAGAFYSFALAGALGGIITALRMRSLLPGAAARDLVPSLTIWSFSFGFASVASNLIGEGLELILPAWAAWFIAYEAMALLVGGGGGYAIIEFSRTHQTAPQARGETDRHPPSENEGQSSIIILIVLCLPFYLNDLTDIFTRDWRLWLLIDYTAVKLLPLVVLIWLIRRGKLGLSSLGWQTPSARSFFLVLAAGALAAVFIEQNGLSIMNRLCSGPPPGGMPAITSPFWRRVDLTLGLALVSVLEETVFRGYLRIFLSRYTRRAWVVIAVSAVAFGLIHWSGGIDKIVVTAAVGAVFMALYLRTRSLPAIMLAHYLVNFIDFADVIPADIFRFF
jgi:membrane protease YdiL (CAAX protease family)